MEELAYQAQYRLILMHSAEDAERERDALLTLESERVDGILISMAQSVEDYQVYRQLIQRGVQMVFFDRCVQGLRIPQDIALVGFSDDIRAGLMPSPLTTIRQPAYEIGSRAAAKLIADIEAGSRHIEDIVVRAEEVIRESCGCVAGKTSRLSTSSTARNVVVTGSSS